MAIRRNLTGQRFGKLTVIEELGGNKIRCRCDCGTVKVYNKSNVSRGLTTSCGCSRKHIRPELIKNTVGNRYGRLVVIKELGYGRVLCYCDCGNEKEVNKGALLVGNILSCGCLLKEGPKDPGRAYKFEGTDISKISSEKPTSRNQSGVRGVCWSASKHKWRANIGVQGKKIDLGYFANKEEAIKARKAAEEKYFHPLIESWKESKKPGK